MCWTSAIIELSSETKFRISTLVVKKSNTSKLILRISWINYVLDKCHRWFIKRDQVSYFNACSEKRHTSKLTLRISWAVNISCSVRGLWVLRECSVSALWGEFSLSALWGVCEYSVSALWVLFERSVTGLWMLCECSVSALWVLCECSVSALRVLGVL